MPKDTSCPASASGSNDNKKCILKEADNVLADFQFPQEMVLPSYSTLHPFYPEAPRINRMSIRHLLNPLPLPGTSNPDRPRRKRGKKPVIYLFSPTVIEATVKLSLVPTWSFSSVYPTVPVETSESGGDVVEWNVRTHKDGSLTELGTGLATSYLFWEADVIPERQINSPQTKSLGLSNDPGSVNEQFNPASCNLSDENAVLLPSSTAAAYLNNVLEMLGLHTEARTSFITFWLPFFLRHKHIALRFLPQSMYSYAAPLTVNPKPDVVTRIFMLFTGVTDEDRPKWGLAEQRAGEDGALWKDVVGIDELCMKDETLFRVLEWGGMEI
ncbi:Ubiquitin-domain-containing protein [Mycena sanguinolenta]|uniref:Ubiquitin-domain-containing protein n=1 Tax=Mycena sanguinolenta TaxID=230812 RepID=A0A8H6YJQ1_9AGAR|nr:Ubiquitin-domain-containing protein [Mycena sanguinolenta]